MASMAAAKKNLCATCEKNTGIFTCGGCSLAFCTKHANEHRQILSKQMDEIVFAHDQIRQSINEQIHEVNQCPPMKEIDEWERQLIHRICQIANNAREKLTQCLKERTKHIQTEVQKLTEKLNKARIEDDFVENDLKLWSDKINKLKTDISTSIPIFVKSIDNDLTLLVSQSHPQNDVEVQMNKSIFTSPEHQLSAFATNEVHFHPRVIELPKTAEGLGLRIMSVRKEKCLIYISQIMPNGVAWKHGGLKIGDRLLSVNDISVENKYHEEVVELIRQSEGRVKLVVCYSPQVVIEMENLF